MTSTFSTLQPAILSFMFNDTFALLLVATALYVVTVSVYRLTLHPLARYPGPFFSKISGWPTVFQAASGSRHLQQLREHQIYGSVVRIGPNSLSYNTHSALRDIYSLSTANVRKADFYLTLDAAAGALSTHGEIDRRKHASRRRVLGHAFSDNAVRSAEDIILQDIRTLCKLLGSTEEDAQPVGWIQKNMGDLSTWLAFDIMGALAFGKRFGCLEGTEHRYVSKLIMESSKFTYWVGYLPFAKLLNPTLNSLIMKVVGGQMARDNIRFTEYAESQLQQRIKIERRSSTMEGTSRKDFAHYLLNSRDPQTGKGFEYSELQADIGLLIAAGADTVATTLSATFFYLVHNPHVLSKLTTELRSTFVSTSEIRHGPKLASCKYFTACIDEALRCSPPAPSHLPREVLPGGIKIDGHSVPPGIVVGVPAYAIHHNEAYYPSPYTFWPERWIVNSDSDVTVESVARARAAFCPFSLGSRGCIGKRVAYMELQLALANIILQYDIRQAAGEPSGSRSPDLHSYTQGKHEYQLADRFICDRRGPMIEVRAL